jgi:hypothetical protein
MFKSIISACKALDAFGLPRAAGNLHTDRFIVANESFLRIAGLGKDEVLIATLSEIVKIDLTSVEPMTLGRLIPITVRTADKAVTIGGQAAISKQGIAFLMIPLFIDPSPEFEIGTAVGKELQRQKVVAYVHDHLAPELLAATFSIEAVRVRLEKENHPCREQLKEVEQKLTGPLRQMGKRLEVAEDVSDWREPSNQPVGVTEYDTKEYY